MLNELCGRRVIGIASTLRRHVALARMFLIGPVDDCYSHEDSLQQVILACQGNMIYKARIGTNRLTANVTTLLSEACNRGRPSCGNTPEHCQGVSGESCETRTK